MSDVQPFGVRNGWTLFPCAAFAETFDGLEAEVARLKLERPGDWENHPKTKLLIRIRNLIFEEIPNDPNALAFRLGNTLGPGRRHWRRAKFMRRFRLFFRFDSASRTIVYAWVNDENTLRKVGAKTDPYTVFGRRLDGGSPPDAWDELLAEAKRANASRE